MMRILVPAMALPAVAAVTGCADGTDFRASAEPIPPVGIAAQGLTASTWTVLTCADFNYDGMLDVLWFDTASHAITIWLMNGNRPLATGPIIPGPPGNDWKARNAVDFNLDGMADVIWHDSAKNLITIWLMKDTELLAAGPAIAGPGEGWDPTTHGDFNGDGMADIFWFNAEKNAVTVWFMNGTGVLAPKAP